MSLSAAISKAVDAAFLAVGDLVKSSTVIVPDQSTKSRDDVTGETTYSSITYANCDIIVTEFTSKESRANVQTGDLRGILKQSEVLTINMLSTVTFDGISHEVIDIIPDPSDSIWDLQLRRKS